MEGHLIDSDILRKAMARIVEEGGSFEVEEFRVGKTNPSRAPCGGRDRLRHGTLTASARGYLLGGTPAATANAAFQPAEADGILPTTSTLHQLRHRGPPGRPLGAGADQRMDCAIVLRAGVPTCVKQRQVKEGEPVLSVVAACGPPARAQRDFSVFGFMRTTCRGDQQGDRHAGAAREMEARDRRARGSWWWRARHRASGATPAGTHGAGTAGWTSCSAATPSPHTTWRRRLKRAGRVPALRARGGGRQPEPPLRDQRRQPRRRHPCAWEKAGSRPASCTRWGARASPSCWGLHPDDGPLLESSPTGRGQKAYAAALRGAGSAPPASALHAIAVATCFRLACARSAWT